ncbi:MAG TPA: hypothetical protein VHI10_12245 [Mycobacterium sp.]|nr:hypothetical protein [Mycobacterium sp.]
MKSSPRTRRLVRTTVSAAALAFAVSPFASLAVASADYKESDFASCLERDMPTDYCCEHAGGVMRNGACINPDDLRVPSGGVFQQAEPAQPVPPTWRPPRVVATTPVLIATR